ncbi:hypothetical protein KRX56_06060 [Dermabacteraceae bacterium TAE3-ERU27]|nr:hypothetical protein [Dermabacteraceae bacterium TAE3-ERU27]
MAKKKFGKKFARQAKRPMVRFTLPEIYGDAVFELPKFYSLPLRSVKGLDAGNTDALMAALPDCGVDAETIEAINDLALEEMEGFLDAWGDAGAIPAGKSSD